MANVLTIFNLKNSYFKKSAFSHPEKILEFYLNSSKLSNHRPKNTGLKMIFRLLIGLIIPLLFSMNSWAESILLNSSHPQQYTVVKGDTLWDISGKFLQNPGQWPQLWKANPHVKNPHLIYPDDILVLKFNADGSPYLSKLRPHIRVKPLDEAIKTIPVASIIAFLNANRVVSKNELTNLPYVIGFADGHLVAGAGHRVYARSIINPNNNGYTIFRQGDAYIDPDTNSVLGYEGQFIARTVLQKLGDPATLLISRAKLEVRKGDRLIENKNENISLMFTPHLPDFSIEATLIGFSNGASFAGRFDITILNKGSDDGLEAGHVLTIYQHGETIRDNYSQQRNDSVPLPNEISGRLMVFRTFKKVSYALIMEANYSMSLLDKAQSF